MIQSLIPSLKRFTSLDQLSLVQRAVPLPLHGASGGTKARTSQALVSLGNAWGNHGVPQPLQPQETLLHQESVSRMFSCHRLGRGSESIPRQLEKERGHCESHACSAAMRSPQVLVTALLRHSSMEPRALLSAQRIAQGVLACPELGACPYCSAACSSHG